jgi:hypothetical protein
MGRIVGPLESFELPDGTKVPFYVIKFDKRGKCVTPKSRNHLEHRLADGAFTDVHLFSHGWNNTPKDAIEAYRKWISGYRRLLNDGGHSFGRPYRPIVVGVVWPSVWIVPWWERGPKIAADIEDTVDDAMIAELIEYVPEADHELFYALAESETLDDDEARRFLELVGPLYKAGDSDIEEEDGPSVDALLAAWTSLALESKGEEEKPTGDDAVLVGAGAGGEAQAAGAVGRAPVDGIRMLSVWQMKDRAGTVGGNGVADLLRRMMNATGGRIHLIGHSFGCKVLLSAICSPKHANLPRPVNSLLLLQPAINQYGMADSIKQTGKGGGYNSALDRVAQPILATFTKDDSALRRFFHLALRRNTDIGEVKVAADEPPSDYAAMGGYGPNGVESLEVIDMQPPGSAYELDGDVPEVYSVRSHGKITGHSDISNDFTYWALYSLVNSS